jgi:hypothetical protein
MPARERSGRLFGEHDEKTSQGSLVGFAGKMNQMGMVNTTSKQVRDRGNDESESHNKHSYASTHQNTIITIQDTHRCRI